MGLRMIALLLRIEYLETVAFNAPHEERIGFIQGHHETLQRVLELGTDRLRLLYIFVHTAT